MKFWVVDRILRKPSASRHLEYLALDRNFNILEISEAVQEFSDSPLEIMIGTDVRMYFPELIGVEDCVLAILEGEEEIFEIKGIARYAWQESPLFMDIYIISDELDNSLEIRLIMLLENVTNQMLSEQRITQKLNEANLTKINLSKANTYLNKLLDSLPDIFLVTTTKGNIKLVNLEAQKLLGYNTGELVNQSILLVMENHNFLNLLIQPSSSTTVNFQGTCKTKTGKTIDVAFSCSVMQTEIENLPDFIYIGRVINEVISNTKQLNQYTPKKRFSAVFE